MYSFIYCLSAIKNAISSVIKRRPCQVSYGGLSDQKVNDLCEFLDNQAAGFHGLPLLDYLSGNGYIPPKTPKKEVLSTYFSLCSEHIIPDKDAVQYLKLVFHELNCTRAAEIIEPGMFLCLKQLTRHVSCLQKCSNRNRIRNTFSNL